MHPDAGRRRVVIEGIQPAIDAGRFPVKRTIGEQVVVEADIFADGHDLLRAVLCYRWARDLGLDGSLHGSPGQRPLAGAL